MKRKLNYSAKLIALGVVVTPAFGADDATRIRELNRKLEEVDQK